MWIDVFSEAGNYFFFVLWGIPDNGQRAEAKLSWMYEFYNHQKNWIVPQSGNDNILFIPLDYTRGSEIQM